MVCSSSTLSTYEYDGLSRRIERHITNQASRNAELHDYYTGQSLIETRVGNVSTDGGDLYRQNTWGLTYVDELVHMGMAPSQSAISYYFEYWVLQDSQFNVVGVVKARKRGGVH
jgi:hypothetical protein